MATKNTRKLKLRYERTQNVSEPYPCYYMEVEVLADELDVFVENDYQARLLDADDPSSVERRDAQEILIEDFNKVEYNNAKKFRRHTHDRNVRTSSGLVPALEMLLTSDGQFADDEAADPADSWSGVVAIWDAINSLPARDRAVLIDVRLNGLSQVEAAKKYGLSQPAVHKSLTRSTKRLGAILDVRL